MGRKTQPERRSSKVKRRGRDSNPGGTFRHLHDFQSCSFNRSDTSPERSKGQRREEETSILNLSNLLKLLQVTIPRRENCSENILDCFYCFDYYAHVSTSLDTIWSQKFIGNPRHYISSSSCPADFSASAMSLPQMQQNGLPCPF